MLTQAEDNGRRIPNPVEIKEPDSLDNLAADERFILDVGVGLTAGLVLAIYFSAEETLRLIKKYYPTKSAPPKEKNGTYETKYHGPFHREA